MSFNLSSSLSFERKSYSKAGLLGLSFERDTWEKNPNCIHNFQTIPNVKDPKEKRR
jgi:hypothetical protein